MLKGCFIFRNFEAGMDKKTALLLMRNIFKITGIALMICGWFCVGIGFTIKMPHPINTTIFVGGLILGVIGVITLGIVILRGK